MPVTGWHVEQRRGGDRINEGRRLEYPAECVDDQVQPLADSTGPVTCPRCGGRVIPPATGLVVSTGNNSSQLGQGPAREAAGWRASSVQYERSVDVPSPTITTNTGRAWRVHEPGGRQVVPRTPGVMPLVGRLEVSLPESPQT